MKDLGEFQANNSITTQKWVSAYLSQRYAEGFNFNKIEQKQFAEFEAPWQKGTRKILEHYVISK